MKKMIPIFVFMLLFSAFVYAEHGRVIADITYDLPGGTSNEVTRLTAYYLPTALAYDTVVSRINSVIIDQSIESRKVTNIRVSPITDTKGSYLATITYDEYLGPSNMKYKIESYYDPKMMAQNAVMTQVQNIRNQLSVVGTPITNLKVGDLQTLDGGYRVDLTYSEIGGNSNVKYHVDEYYEPKAQAKDLLEDQIMTLQNTQKWTGTPITNLKIGAIKEVDGGYSADVTYDEIGGNSNMKQTLDEFYDPKKKAHDEVEEFVQNVKNQQKLNGIDITNIKIGDIQDVKGGYVSNITYDQIGGPSKQVYAEKSFYDPLERAINSVNNQIDNVKSQLQVNGLPITRLRVGKVIIQ